MRCFECFKCDQSNSKNLIDDLSLCMLLPQQQQQHHCNSHRFARSETVFDVALEDDTVGLGEPKSLVDADQGVALRRETGEDSRVDRAALVIDDGESGARVLKVRKNKG